MRTDVELIHGLWLTHWNAVPGADTSNLRDLFGRVRVDDRQWKTVGIDRRPFRVSMLLQVVLVGADRLVAQS